MRNLILVDKLDKKLSVHVRKIVIDNKLDNYNNIVTCDDELSATDNRTFLCTDTQLCSYQFELNKLVKLRDLCFEEPGTKVVGLEFLIFNKEVCYVYDNGEIWTWNLAEETGESIIKCDEQLEAVSWSPDQEIIVIVTRSKKMCLMDHRFNLIYETDLDDTSFGDQEFITVGWGKKETQFHGSEGKHAALKKDELQNGSHSTIDKTIKITWRGDGELYAISFVGINGRMFKIFNKDGILQFTSEKLSGLEECIIWKPSGSWIAVPQVLPNKYVITLFEKNGLRHRELVLPFKNTDQKIIDLGWSLDSEVLSVVTINYETNVSSIYLYTINNYHWYLKHQLIFDSIVIQHQWMNENCQTTIKSKSLQIVLSNSRFLLYQWDYRVISSTTDEAIVAVIDGPSLLITNFNNAIVPPPMSTIEHKNNVAINTVDFLKDENKFFTIDAANILKLMKLQFDGKNIKAIDTYFEFDLNELRSDDAYYDIMPPHFYHCLWIAIDKILFCNEDKIFLYKISVKDQKLIQLKYFHEHGRIMGISRIDENSIMFGNRNIITTLQLNANHKTDDDSSLSVVIEDYDQIRNYDANTLVIFKNRGNLIINRQKIFDSFVSSFYILEQYLVFTTIDKIYFYNFDKKKITFERKIETGGRICLIIPKTSKVVLQLPRGNLEVIEPRILSISIIGRFLDNLDYFNAFDLLRKQRINLNLIVDHNRDKFIENISLFLNQITNQGSIHWLNLFLSELQNEDVTRTMYKSNYEINEENIIDVGNNNKVWHICEILCDIMENINSNQYMLPIITSYVKRKNIEKSLDVLWDHKQNEIYGENWINSQKQHVKADDALKYLICLVDVNELYNIALGMYNFNLVMFVANKSQKDPKEYLPYLNELKAIEDENYRKYKIDMHLKRHDAALVNLINCNNDFYADEIIDLIQRHELHSKALNLLVDEHSNIINWNLYKKIAIIYGNYLREKGGLKVNFYQSSIMYERGGDIKQSILSSKHILNYQRCVYLMKKNNATDKEIKEFCTSLIPALIDGKQFMDCADIFIKYDNNNYKNAIKILLQGNHFIQAQNTWMENYNEEELETAIRKPLEAVRETVMNFLTESHKKFVAYKTRLQIVREKRKAFPNEGYGEGDYDFNDDASSVMSVGSKESGRSSKQSGKSTTSSKNRRKHERKLLSLKEGSPYEEFGLIDALAGIMTSILNYRNDVVNLNSVLIENSLDRVAAHIQKAYRTILTEMLQSVDKIYCEQMKFLKVTEDLTYARLQQEKYYSLLNPFSRIKPDTSVFTFIEYDLLKDLH